MPNQWLPDCVNSLCPLFSKKACESLADLVAGKGEFLPVDFDGDTKSYFFFHCMRSSDALDVSKSTIHYLEPGLLDRIEHFKFSKKRAAQETVFRLAIDPLAITTYVTSEVVDRVNKTGLTGFEFEEVWSVN